MKKILAIHTGGTISMTEDEEGHVKPSMTNPMNQVPSFFPHIQVESIDLFNLPSPHITPEHMLQIYQIIKTRSDEVDGVVITHGTDTLEETAYFLDTMDLPDLAVVITGAMRSANEVGSDSIYNYYSALRVAASDKARDKGVLVVMNDEIHAAKYVTKTHTSNVSTFQTPTHGPLGLITKQQLLFFKQAEPRVRFDLTAIRGNVPIIKAYAGMTGELFGLLAQSPIDGLVIEALGAGNLPPQAAEAVQVLLARSIPVVLVSRCFNGIAEPVYAYQGGGVPLSQKGIMFVKELNGPKARLKLLIALNAGLAGSELKDYMEG